MNIQQAYNQFQFRLNKLGTNANQSVPLGQFVSLINKAQLHWAEARSRVLERDQTRVDELAPILKSYKKTPTKKKNYYSVPLPEDYFHPVRAYSTTSCGPLYMKPTEEGNVNVLLSNEHTRPSAEWEETFYTVMGKEMRVYVTNFTIGDVELNYLCLPREVDIVGYIRVGGAASTNIDLEFEGVHAEEIIDLAAMLASSDIGDMERLQTLGQHIQANP